MEILDIFVRVLLISGTLYGIRIVAKDIKDGNLKEFFG